LRHIEMVGSDAKTDLPKDLDVRMKRAIAAAGLYSTVEDAYVSYSRGYATAEIISDDTIRFDPPGGELDARLRFFSSGSSSSDRLNPTELPKLELPDLLDREHGRKLVDTLLNSKLEQAGGLRYHMDETLLVQFAEGFRVYFAGGLEMPMTTVFGKTSLDGIVRAYSMICAASRLHKWVTILSKPDGLDKSVNWPSLWRSEAEWKQMLGLICAPEEVETLVGLLRLNPRSREADVALTPLVDLGEGYLAVAPTGVLRANFFRNVLVLLSRNFPKEYSTYSSGREKLLIEAARQTLGGSLISDCVRLPVWGGSQLPDIDLLLGDAGRVHLAVAEVKWQLSGSSTREVINRDEYLKKGLRQLEAVRGFLSAHPDFLRSRGLLDRATEAGDFDFVLLCKGHLGSETIQSFGIEKCDYDTFIEQVGKEGLESAVRLARDHSYLPHCPRDFTIEPISVRFGKWRLLWWTLVPVGLPDDDEAQPVLDFYDDSAEFLR
jgi:hypothetical protein